MSNVSEMHYSDFDNLQVLNQQTGDSYGVDSHQFAPFLVVVHQLWSRG